jgi:MFS family permease
MSDKLVDKASALQNMAYALGAGIGPVLGGKLTDMYGFRKTADIISMMTLVYTVINFGIVFLPGMLCKKLKTERLHRIEKGSESLMV